jgi:hypothetical protein
MASHQVNQGLNKAVCLAVQGVVAGFCHGSPVVLRVAVRGFRGQIALQNLITGFGEILPRRDFLRVCQNMIDRKNEPLLREQSERCESFKFSMDEVFGTAAPPRSVMGFATLRGSSVKVDLEQQAKPA